MQDEGYNPALRPIAISVDNIFQSLPQHGTSQARLTYEMVTEGGITRLLCVFDNCESLPVVGSVRSGRDSFVQQVIPLAAIYMQYGSSTYASAMLEEYGWQNKLIECFSDRDTAAWVDEERRSAGYDRLYTVFTDAEHVANTVKKLGLDVAVRPENDRGFVFNFIDEETPRVLQGGNANSAYTMLSTNYNVSFLYNEGTKKYEKHQYGRAVIDANNDKPITYTNVFLLFTEIMPYGDTPVQKIDFHANGFGFYINGGNFEKIRWKKGNPEEPLLILNADGSEAIVQINPGESYISFADYSFYDSVLINQKDEILQIIKKDPRSKEEYLIVNN